MPRYLVSVELREVHHVEVDADDIVTANTVASVLAANGHTERASVRAKLHAWTEKGRHLTDDEFLKLCARRAALGPSYSPNYFNQQAGAAVTVCTSDARRVRQLYNREGNAGFRHLSVASRTLPAHAGEDNNDDKT